MTQLKEGLREDRGARGEAAGGEPQAVQGPRERRGIAVYVMLANPAVKNVGSWFLSLLYKALPADAQALYQKWTDAKAPNPPSVFDLTLVTKFQ